MSGFSQQAILRSWLLLYAAWRLFTAFNYGVAAYRFESGIFLFYFGAIAALAVLSLVGIAVLWQRKRIGLFVFASAELISAIVQAMFGNFVDAIYPVVAVASTWLAAKRAKPR